MNSKFIISLSSFLAFQLLSLGGSGGIADAQQAMAIKAGKILTMNGDPIENGVILIRDGRISAIGKDLEIPVEAKIVDASNQVVMPGFVEAHSPDGMGQANESNPIVPYLSVLDEINPMDPYFQEARRNGVTSVAITPGNSTMIGGQAAVIKTGGEFIDAMVLKADAGVKISLRPVQGSRMSHMAKLRETLNDAKKKLEKKEAAKSKPEAEKKSEGEQPEGQQPEGQGRGRRGRGRGPQPNPESADSSDNETQPQEETKTDAEKKPEAKEEKTVESELDKAMFALLSGKLPAIIYCEKAMDVGAALRLIDEYKLDAKLVLGKDCYKAAEQVAKSGLPVIADPELVFWEEDPRTKEETKVILPQIYQKHSIPYAFQVGRSSSATLGRNYLWYQAATAVRYGMPEATALESLTTLPAKIHGIDQFVGSLAEGKDADLVILSGDPLKIDTWVEKTIVNGEIVYEKESDEQLKRLLTGEKAGE